MSGQAVMSDVARIGPTLVVLRKSAISRGSEEQAFGP
jgi:hypothetical protein